MLDSGKSMSKLTVATFNLQPIRLSSLALRICTSCNTLRFGYMKINFLASLTLNVFVVFRLSSFVSRL